MQRASPKTITAAMKAAQKLCHLSMRYVGALLEAVTGKKVGLLPISHPGLHESRDLINLILLCRAEQNAISKALIEADLVSHERLTQLFTEEYTHFMNVKAEALHVQVFDGGLQFDTDELRRQQDEKN